MKMNKILRKMTKFYEEMTKYKKNSKILIKYKRNIENFYLKNGFAQILN